MENKIDNIRENILKQLTELMEKIETNEEFPENEQSISALYKIHDNIEECLNMWYY